jgi:hypothetical protein
VPLDDPLQLGLAGRGVELELELAVEGVQTEDVPMPPVPGRCTGPSIADRSEVVAPLARRGLALAQPARGGVESPRDPVREDAPRRIEVVDDERQRSRPVRNVRPAKRRREILAVAHVPARDRLRVVEGGALEDEIGHQQVRWSVEHVVEVGQRELVSVRTPPVRDRSVRQHDHVARLLFPIDNDSTETVCLDPRHDHLRLSRR